MTNRILKKTVIHLTILLWTFHCSSVNTPDELNIVQTFFLMTIFVNHSRVCHTHTDIEVKLQSHLRCIQINRLQKEFQSQFSFHYSRNSSRILEVKVLNTMHWTETNVFPKKFVELKCHMHAYTARIFS